MTVVEISIEAPGAIRCKNMSLERNIVREHVVSGKGTPPSEDTQSMQTGLSALFIDIFQVSCPTRLLKTVQVRRLAKQDQLGLMPSRRRGRILSGSLQRAGCLRVIKVCLRYMQVRRLILV
jgi:hypothetical protein